MKSFIKLVAVVIACSLTTELYAQNYKIKAGLNLSNILKTRLSPTSSYADNEEYNMKYGFLVGATVEFPQVKRMSFETGLFLSTKGFKMIRVYPTDIVDGDYNLVYLEIPLTAKASFDLAGVHIYGVFGPLCWYRIKRKNEI